MKELIQLHHITVIYYLHDAAVYEKLSAIKFVLLK